MRTREEGKKLATLMVEIGRRMGKRNRESYGGD